MIDKTAEALSHENAESTEPQPEPIRPIPQSCRFLHPDTYKPREVYRGILDRETGTLIRLTK